MCAYLMVRHQPSSGKHPLSRCAFLLLTVTLWSAMPVLAQEFIDKPADRPAVGLALSGGGVRGVAHIAVLEAIEELGIPVDLIVGTSMGSVMGGLYASGYSAADLRGIVRETDWNQLLSDRPRRRYLTMEEKMRDGVFIATLPLTGLRAKLPSGLVAGQRVAETLARLTWPVHHVKDFSELPIPFACLATDAVSGEPVRIQKGNLAKAIRASMSFPSAFTPEPRNGRLLIDGGVVRNLPAEDVRELGADVVICSDVSKPLSERDELDSIISIMEQTFNFQYWDKVEEQRATCDLVIAPDVGEIGTFAFGEWERILDVSRVTVDNMWLQLVALADSIAGDGDHGPDRQPASVDSVAVAEIVVEGLEAVPRSVVEGQMDIDPPQWVSVDEIERDIERIYSTRFFERVTYVLEPVDRRNASRLQVRVIERTDDELRFGFRYDPRTQARMRLNAVYKNVISRGSKLSLVAEVGEALAFSTDYFFKFGLWRRAGIRARALVARRKFDEYLDGEPVAQISTNLARVEVGVSTLFSTRAYTGLSVIGEVSRTGPRISSIPDRDDLHAFVLLPAATFWYETFDRLSYPNDGIFLFMRSVVSHPEIGSDVSMSRHRLIFSGATRISGPVTLETNLEFAAIFGDRNAIPAHWRLGLGGANKGVFETGRFIGLDLNERSGRYISKAGVRLRIEVRPRRYLLLEANAGTAGDDILWKLDLNRDGLIGYGIGFGMSTVVGPIELMLTDGNADKPGVVFNLGYRFNSGF